VARKAVPDIVHTLNRWNEHSYEIPAICEGPGGDSANALAALSNSLGGIGDQTTIDSLFPLVKNKLPDHISQALQEIKNTIEARLESLPKVPGSSGE
jgi:hypothetical protein